MSGRKARVPWLLLILAGALVLRIGAAVAVQKWVERTPGRLCLIEGDADGYWKLGRSLARGEEYSVYGRKVLRMPGFPLLLAGVTKIFGENLLAARFVLALVGTAACGLVYRLSRDLFDEPTARVAAGLAAVCPAFVVFSVLLLSETLFATLLLASLVAFARLVRGAEGQRNRGAEGQKDRRTEVPPAGLSVPPSFCPSAPLSPAAFRAALLWACAAGVACGAATLVRPTWLLVGPGFVAVWLVACRFRREAFWQGAILLGCLAATLLPWALRNARVTGHPIITTLWVGPSLYDGLNPQATGASEMSFVESDPVYLSLSEYDADRHFRRAAWDFVKAHPGRTLELAAIKLWRFWSPFPNAEQFRHPVAMVALAGFSAPVLALAACGAWRVRRALWAWLIPAAPILYFSLVHAVFVGSLRYRLPAEYALLPLAACGALALWHRRSAAGA